MSTAAQISANQKNAEHSSGPRSETGKAASSRNHLIHGLSGAGFHVLEGEDQNAFNELFTKLTAEYQPASGTEEILVEQMAQSAWLRLRAVRLQESCFEGATIPAHREKSFILYIRYYTTHDRAFHKALQEMLKLRAQTRKAEIGFVSQERKREEDGRRQAAEKRKQEMHEINLIFGQAKVDTEISRRLAVESEMHLNNYRAERLAEAAKAA